MHQARADPMSVPFIVRAGLDDLIPVIIVFTVIITRIIKAARAAKPLQPPPPPDRSVPPDAPRQPAREPADELREFLEALSGGEPARPKPPPPRTPVQPVPRQPILRAAPPPPPARPMMAERAMAQPTQRPVPARKTQPQPPRTLPRSVYAHTTETNPLRDSLTASLRGRQSLRNAWLLREVLGPPVGLRP